MGGQPAGIPDVGHIAPARGPRHEENAGCARENEAGGSIDVLENAGNRKARQSMNATLGLAKPRPVRIPELDGLLGVAIVSVMLYHYMADAPGYGTFGLAYKFRQLFRMGWSGVDLFFVLSGFLIGGILLDARKSNSTSARSMRDVLSESCRYISYGSPCMS